MVHLRLKGILVHYTSTHFINDYRNTLVFTVDFLQQGKHHRIFVDAARRPVWKHRISNKYVLCGMFQALNQNSDNQKCFVIQLIFERVFEESLCSNNAKEVFYIISLGDFLRIRTPNTDQLNPLFYTFAEFRLIVNRIVALQSTDWLAANAQFSPNALSPSAKGRHQNHFMTPVWNQ